MGKLVEGPPAYVGDHVCVNHAQWWMDVMYVNCSDIGACIRAVVVAGNIAWCLNPRAQWEANVGRDWCMLVTMGALHAYKHWAG
jgi:hypothetical protein